MIEQEANPDSIRGERKRRGWSQQEAADAAGVSLRTYQAYEAGRSRPQAGNLRSIHRAFNVGVPDEDRADETRGGWPGDVRVFLDTIGAYLMTLDQDAREAFIRAEVRRIIDRH